jgi:hypothetical protein
MSLTSYRAAPPRVNVVPSYSYFALLRQVFVFSALFPAFSMLFLLFVFAPLPSSWQEYSPSSEPSSNSLDQKTIPKQSAL